MTLLALAGWILSILTMVASMHNLYIEPTKKYADFIITKGVKNTFALVKVISNIISMINNQKLVK